jgi:hypothetical protein
MFQIRLRQNYGAETGIRRLVDQEDFLLRMTAMRAKLMTMFGLFGIAWIGSGIGTCGGEGDRKPPEKKSPAEIEKLVKDLGDENFAIREDAFKRLAQTPGALAELRRFLNDKVLERRRRVEILVQDLAQKNFKNMLREIVNRKHEAPLDLLVELVRQNIERMDYEDWKGILGTIDSITANIAKHSKVKPLVPYADEDFLTYPLVGAELLSLEMKTRGVIARAKFVGDRIVAKGGHALRTVVAATSLESFEWDRCIILANGKISLRFMTGSFVFSDEDVICERLCSCLVITRGRVRAKTIDESIVIEGAADSSRVALFSMKTLGLALVQEHKTLRVEKVVRDSPAGRCGFRAGDVILLESLQANSLRTLERVVRRSLAEQTNLVLQVRREGRQQSLVLSFLD